jgi:hypothetical protein
VTAAKKTKKVAPGVAPAAEVITAFKGFEMNMQCRGYQYKAGDTYEHDGAVKACNSGFHSCENPLDVFEYYPPGGSVYAEVEASGSISRDTDDSKIASGKLHIKTVLTLPDYIGRAIAWVTAHCNPDTSSHAEVDSSASSATGVAAVAMNIGRYGRAKAGEGGAIVLCEHDDDGNLLHIRASKVGENVIEPDCFYTLTNGEFVRAQS